jgi:hypothetical protein
MNALDNSNVGSENVKSHTEREIAIPEDEPSGVEAMTSVAVVNSVEQRDDKLYVGTSPLNLEIRVEQK